MNISAEQVREEAIRQLREESFKRAVEQEKTRLQRHVPFWHRVFPFIIRIERRKS